MSVPEAPPRPRTHVEDFAMATVMDAAEGLNPSYEEAKLQEDWPKWQEAIKAELDSLKANGTWSLIKRPTEANVVDCKWVLQIKKNAGGRLRSTKRVWWLEASRRYTALISTRPTPPLLDSLPFDFL